MLNTIFYAVVKRYASYRRTLEPFKRFLVYLAVTRNVMKRDIYRYWKCSKYANS